MDKKDLLDTSFKIERESPYTEPEQQLIVQGLVIANDEGCMGLYLKGYPQDVETIRSALGAVLEKMDHPSVQPGVDWLKQEWGL